MANLGDTPEFRRALYELQKTCSADIPECGEFYTFDEYLAERIQTLSTTQRSRLGREQRFVGRHGHDVAARG